MKRNRKAEAFTKQRKLNKQETEKKRISVLLTEMEAASAQILREHFDFTDEQVDRFLELTRLRFQDLPAVRPRGSYLTNQTEQMKLIAQRYGLAAMQVLTKDFGFEGKQADTWLQQMIRVGNENREKVNG
jgi:hypothetical protein